MKIFAGLALFVSLLFSNIVLAAAISCQNVYLKIDYKSQLKSFINVGISQKLLELGYQPQAIKKPSILKSARLAYILKKSTPAKLANPYYREDLASSILSLELSSQLSVADAIDLEISPRRRELLNQTILRSVIRNGLKDIAPTASQLTLFQKVKWISSWIRRNPITNILLRFQLPEFSVVLNEDQLTDLILNGQNGQFAQLYLHKLAPREELSQVTRRFNSFAAPILTTALIVFSAQDAVAFVKDVNQVIVAHQTENNKKLEDSVDAASKAPSDLILQEAQGEIKTVITAFEQRYNDEPTQDELAEIKRKICDVEYGNALSESQFVRCMN